MVENPRYTVVIRSTNERTVKVCQEIVEEESAGQEVATIYKTPFKLALEECYKIAIEKQSKWLITVDADMLILPGALNRLYNSAEQMPGHYVQVQGRIFDKITGTIRKAGPRIYRVELLEKALEISESMKDQIRPEAQVIAAMGEAGHPSRYISVVTSLHDFEQYYSDLYRKSIVHAKKHDEFVSRIISRSVNNMEEDPDYRVILKALWDGLTKRVNVSIDSRLYKDEAQQALSELNLVEKGKLTTEFNLSEYLSEKVPETITRESSEITFHDQPKPNYSIFTRFQNIIRKKGFLDGIRFGVGTLFTDIGDRLKGTKAVNEREN